MNNCFILLAAGKGKRLKSKIPKQFINYKNKPLFMHSIDKAKESKLFKKLDGMSSEIKSLSSKLQEYCNEDKPNIDSLQKIAES